MAEKAAQESIVRVLTKPSYHGALDVSPGNLILRKHSRGWMGHPALRGHRDGVSASNAFTVKNLQHTDATLVIDLADPIAGIEIKVTYTLKPK